MHYKICEKIKKHINIKINYKDKKNIEEKIKIMNLNIDSNSYILCSVLISFLISFFYCIIFLFLFKLDLIESFLFFIIFFSIFSLFLIKKINYDFLIFEKKIESEIFSASSKLYILLSNNVSFLDSLKATEKDLFFLKFLIKDIFLYNNMGNSIPLSIAMSVKKYNSNTIKQFSNGLLIAYQNKDYSSLKSLSEISFSQTQNRFDEISSILLNISIFYVVVSCVLPIFIFMILNILPFFGFSFFGFFRIFLIFSVVLPSILIFCFFVISLFCSETENYSFLEEQEKINKKEIVYLVFFVLFFFLILSLFFPFPLAFFSFIIPWFYLFKKTKNKNDPKKIVDALFYISGFSQGISLEKLIEKISKENFGHVSSFFLKIDKKIKSGMSVKEVLQDEKRLNVKEPLLKRAILIIWSSYNLSSRGENIISKAAHDISLYFSLLNKRKASFTNQKYTIYISSIFILPSILAMNLNMNETLSIIRKQTEVNSLSNQEMSLIFFTYLFLFSIISTLIIMKMDSKKSIISFFKNLFLMISIQPLIFYIILNF